MESAPGDGGSSSLKGLLCAATCPACGHHVAVPLFDGGQQPLATVAWPATAAAARRLPRHPLRFVRCVDCGHVYNADFDYAAVPYTDKPNRMFNRGAVWSSHLDRVRELILGRLCERPTVVEIGCGDGALLRALAEHRPEGRFVGFDPHASAVGSAGPVETRQALFEAELHLAELEPDLIISRHVLEHLMNPLGFVQSISFAASWERLETCLFIEVPCIDTALATGRTVDFYYEHNSHFTTRSLERLLARCATTVEGVERGFGDEVVYGLARFDARPEQVALAREALAFRTRSESSRLALARELDALAASGARVALWGGTGKGAAFVHQYGLDAERFPVVVDSDRDKAGSFVPGTGQEIRFRDHLLEEPAEVIVITTQWRAPDIVREIQSCGIRCPRILLEHEGRLVDYHADPHPYRLV